MSERTILIVEDEESIRRGLRDTFRSEGYHVLEAADGLTALALGLREDPELVILDVMLPGMNGFEVLRRWRADGLDTPVILLTARGLEQDRVEGLRLGADDYVVKPCGIDELLARVETRLRTWDRERGLLDRTTIPLDGCVVDLVAYFLDHEGEAVTRAAILDAVWGDEEVVSRVVDTAILGLRKKIEADASAPRHVISVRAVGYRFQR
jgi:DNA-binding response OmpR family regulator